MKRKLSEKNGYSLIEVLVAVAILMFSIVGPMTIATKSIQSAQYAKQQTTAFFLAQEGVSMTENIRNASALETFSDHTDPWSWTKVAPFDTPCTSTFGCNFSLNSVGGIGNVQTCTAVSPDVCTLRYNPAVITGFLQRYHTLSNSDSQSIYKRIIKWTVLSPDEILVTSSVEWDSSILGGKQSVTVSSSLFNKYKDL